MGTPYAEVIGDPIGDSKSPLSHKFWLERLGLPHDYRRTQVAPDELEAFLAERRLDPDWRGCSVALPHKQAVMPLLDAVTETARRIGAVNTIIPTADGLVGDNTDAFGFRSSIEERYGDIDCEPAVVLGAGGAARAVLVALQEMGIRSIILANRTHARAVALAEELGVSLRDIEGSGSEGRITVGDVKAAAND